MEEAFKREKEESDRLLRKQKLEYETKIVELQKQVMETSMSQSMFSSGLVDSSLIRQQTLPEDLIETDNDTVNCKLILINSLKLIFPSLSDCSWSERDYQLAWWTWKKWRYHRMTSLRVGFNVSLFCFVFSCNLFFIISHIILFTRQRFYSFPLIRIIQIVFSLFG